MTLFHDPQADGAYLALPGHPRTSGSVAWTAPIDRGWYNVGVYADFDAAGHLIGIEVLQASALLRPELLLKALPLAESDGPGAYRRRSPLWLQETTLSASADSVTQEHTTGERQEEADSAGTVIWVTFDPVASMGSIYLTAAGESTRRARKVGIDARVLATWVMFSFDAHGYLVSIEVNGSAMTPKMLELAIR